ncbi:MAG: putative porin, partial [Gillisia sp.]
PTPWTEIYFKTVPDQGQNVDAFCTVNTSPLINFSVAYKGLRALGKYQNSLTSTGNFRATFSYRNKNDRYQLHMHFVSQDLLNQENGGLSALALEQYLSKEKEFEDRSLLEVKYENAENVLFGKRFFVNHSFDLLSAKANTITLTHQLNFNDQKYIFRQDAPVKYYGETFKTSGLRDEVKKRQIENQLELTYKNSILGQLGFKASSSYYNYGYQSVIFLGDQYVPNSLNGTNYAVGADYQNTFGPVGLYGDAMLNLVGDFSGYYFKAGATYRVNENNFFKAEFRSNDRAPNFNFLLYQSDYLNYNWYNNFSNQNAQTLSLALKSLKLLDATAEINRVGNYTYFAKNSEDNVKPFQAGSSVAYLKLRAHRLFNFGVFSLDNTLMYQNVSEGKELLNVPAFVTRNSLFYHDYWFQKALFLQTGFTFRYFSKYNMNGYDPVLAEFYVQNDQQLGGFPMVDFFFNAKIKQTRIFFKLEHVNTLLNGNNNFVAPEYPYPDFIIRFGLVWDFFM